MKGIRGRRYLLQAFPGADIFDLEYYILNGYVRLDFDILLIHVGTNNINNCQIADFDYRFNRLISSIQRLLAPHTQLLFSAILPRPVDYDYTKNFVVAVNKLLRGICSRRNVQFIKTYKAVVKFGEPITELFSTMCRLHLSHPGNIKLTMFLNQVFCNC